MEQKNHHLNFLNKDAQLLTSFLTTGAFPGTPVFLRDTTVVTGSDINTVHFVKPDGQGIASLGPLGPLESNQAYMTAPTVMNDGTVVIGSNDGHVYFLETDPLAARCSTHPK